MKDLPLKIYHHQLKNKQLLGTVISIITNLLITRNYTVGQLHRYTVEINNKIEVLIFRRTKHWTIYIKEVEDND